MRCFSHHSERHQQRQTNSFFLPASCQAKAKKKRNLINGIFELFFPLSSLGNHSSNIKARMKKCERVFFFSILLLRIFFLYYSYKVPSRRDVELRLWVEDEGVKPRERVTLLWWWMVDMVGRRRRRRRRGSIPEAKISILKLSSSSSFSQTDRRESLSSSLPLSLSVRISKEEKIFLFFSAPKSVWKEGEGKKKF